VGIISGDNYPEVEINSGDNYTKIENAKKFPNGEKPSN